MQCSPRTLQQNEVPVLFWGILYTLTMHKLSIFVELWHFMRIRKQWWLFPLLCILLMLGLMLIFAQTSPLAPFIYTII